MIGSEYSKHPEILLSSFTEMNNEYKKKVSKSSSKTIISLLQKVYLTIFGIPEIGFQLRSLYFSQIVSKYLSSYKPKRVLDAGSGIGIYVFWLSSFFSKAEVDGLEYDKQKMKFSQKFLKELRRDKIKFFYGDITKKPKELNAYNLIVNIDVLEHIEDYKKVLKHFYMQLAPKGYLYIHTPQPHQKRIFKKLEKWHHEDHIHEGFTPEELVLALEKLGFKIIERKNTFGFFGSLAWELNHLAFEKGFIVSGITYPFLYVLARLDAVIPNRRGLATAILAKKK